VTDDDGSPADEAWRRPPGGAEDPGAGQRPAAQSPTFRRPADPHGGAPSPWRRPPDGPGTGASQAGPAWPGLRGSQAHSSPPADGTPGPPGDPHGVSPPYSGPPPTQAPPRGWRPPTVIRSPDPRDLPAQDLDAIVRDERGARTLTLGVGMIAGAVALIVTCLLCSRVLF
jgi:hypothetical protein